jgi:hypothetical protein
MNPTNPSRPIDDPSSRRIVVNLPPETLDAIDQLTGRHEGDNRSDVIAMLIQKGLATYLAENPTVDVPDPTVEEPVVGRENRPVPPPALTEWDVCPETGGDHQPTTGRTGIPRCALCGARKTGPHWEEP